MPYGAARSNMQSMRPRSSGDRASASGAEGRRFESCRGHHGLRQLEAVFGHPPKHRMPRRALRNPIRLVSASAALAEGSNDAQHHHPDRGAHRAQQRSAAPTAREPLRRPGVLGVRRLRLGLADEYGGILAAAGTTANLIDRLNGYVPTPSVDGRHEAIDAAKDRHPAGSAPCPAADGRRSP